MNKVFNYTCQGESHKTINKVCQDYSLSYSDDELSIIVVCDGHGGDRYFRSDVGAAKAANITLDSIKLLVKEIGPSFFEGLPYTAIVSKRTEITKSIDRKETEQDKLFLQLFSSIIANWNIEIAKYTENNPITDKERATVKPEYIKSFIEGDHLEKTYGCTLMSFVRTKTYWFAFHIGDGKCIAFDENAKWSEPIPWDDLCFLNKTTSICDSEALNNFRYCYEGDGHFPICVFMGSDGMEDSFGPEENLVNFYIEVLKLLAKSDTESAENLIKKTLPELSRHGSQDDMSVAIVYSPKELEDTIPIFVKYQITEVENKKNNEENKLKQLFDKIKVLLSKRDDTKNTRINLWYAEKDIRQEKQIIKELGKKHELLLKEKGEPTLETNIDNSIKELSQKFDDLILPIQSKIDIIIDGGKNDDDTLMDLWRLETAKYELTKEYPNDSINTIEDRKKKTSDVECKDKDNK